MLRSFFRRSLAALFSILVPGSGQTFNRQPKKGLVILVLANVFFLFAAALALFSTFPGFVIGASVELFFVLYVIVDSAVCGGPKAKERPGFSSQRAWYVFAIILITVNGTGAGTNFYEHHLLGVSARVCQSSGMAPTLQAGDRFVSDSHYYVHRSPQRGDVVVFRKSTAGGAVDYVKRIIAVGGDTVEGRTDGVYLNGQLLHEPYTKYNSQLKSADTKRIFGPVKVPLGEYFLVGDNRDDSWDSRYYGTVPRPFIEEHLLYIWWSHDRSRIGQSIH